MLEFRGRRERVQCARSPDSSFKVHSPSLLFFGAFRLYLISFCSPQYIYENLYHSYLSFYPLKRSGQPTVTLRTRKDSGSGTSLTGRLSWSNRKEYRKSYSLSYLADLILRTSTLTDLISTVEATFVLITQTTAQWEHKLLTDYLGRVGGVRIIKLGSSLPL